MFFKDTKETIKKLIPTRKPILLLGSPGIGKSAMMQKIADELQFDSFIDIRGTTLRPPDLRGLMYLSETEKKGEKEAKFAPMSLLPRSGKHLILFDELPTCTMEVQASLYQLLLDRKLGEYKVPKETIILAAGNRQQDKAGASKLLTPLQTRFITTIELQSNLEDWSEWAVSEGNIRPEVIAFLRLNPDSLNNFDPRSNDNAYACERSWEHASIILDTLESFTILRESLCGSIGSIAGESFFAFLSVYKDICKIPDLIQNPHGYPVPTSPEELYSITSALSYASKKENLKDILTYVERIPNEFITLFSSDFSRRHPQLIETVAYCNFVSRKTEVLSA